MLVIMLIPAERINPLKKAIGALPHMTSLAINMLERLIVPPGCFFIYNLSKFG